MAARDASVGAREALAEAVSGGLDVPAHLICSRFGIAQPDGLKNGPVFVHGQFGDVGMAREPEHVNMGVQSSK